MGNRIKVGLQVRIHDIGVSLMKQSVHPSQGVLAAVAWAKPITVACKVPLEDRFQNITQCSLDDAVTNRGNAQRSFFFRSRFGNPNSFNGLGSVCSRPERLCQTAEVVLQSLLKHLDGLMIDPWTALVRLYQSKSAPKVRQRVDLIHQAVPLASSHPVFQGRQHAFRPDTRFNPGPSVTDLSDRFSPERHWSRLFFRLPGTHVSTFLPPFAPRPLRRLIATMEALTPACLFPVYRSPCFTYSTFRTIPSPTTLCSSDVAFPSATLLVSASDLRPLYHVLSLSRTQASGDRSRLHRRIAGSPKTPGRNGFVILRTGRSPPVALHPASRRRSYSRLQAVA